MKIRQHTELEVYKKGFDAAMRIFDVAKRLPKEETYSLTNQIRRSSRSICANLAEAWRKRRYKAAFIAKLSDAEGEGAETQVWIQLAVACGYGTTADAEPLSKAYDEVLRLLMAMINKPEIWIIAR